MKRECRTCALVKYILLIKRSSCRLFRRIQKGRRAPSIKSSRYCVPLLALSLFILIVVFVAISLQTDFINIIDPLDPTMYDAEPRNHSGLSLCSNISKTFRGTEPVSQISKELYDLEHMFPELENGRLRPKDCYTSYRVAIIIPYRNRRKNLVTYLYNMIPKLQRQRIDVTIFVAEQAPGSSFNRGMMKNIGFLEASKVGQFDCFVFNDVDTIPVDDRNLFRCKKGTARHMVSSVDRFGNTIMYRELFGGIIAISHADFVKINGYSNVFFRWGSEDDNILSRSWNAGLRIDRVYNPRGYVVSLSHGREQDDGISFFTKVVATNIIETSSLDGLNRLVYKTVKVEQKKLFVWITAEVNEDKVFDAYKNIPWNRVTVTNVLKTIISFIFFTW